MRKTILGILIVLLVTTPCLAQEIEPDGLFSLHGTRWAGCGISFYTFPPFVYLPCLYMGFYEGEVYSLSNNASYVDLLVVSLVYDIEFAIDEGWQIFLGIMQPIGIGVFTVLGYTPHASLGPGIEDPPALLYVMGIMFNVEDNWIPEAQLSHIYPIHGEQGTTLTDVQLYGIYTTFQDNPPVEISFDPPDGLTVSNINVISNTLIEFDLEIAANAPGGDRTVIVTYDNGDKVLEHSFYVGDVMG